MPRLLGRSLAVLAGIAALLAAGWVGKLWYDSRLPTTYNVMDFGRADFGGGREHAGHGSGTHSTSVADLHGPRQSAPDATFTLATARGQIRLASGRTVDGLTFNGRSPGPELRVRQGDLVQVTLANVNLETGVTIHWHGVDVPNAEDGVAGVTQNAVLPGAKHVYRFRAERAGTFWYHTHQASAKEVRRGLFGPLVVEPTRGVPADALDLAVVAHTFDGIPTLNGSDLVLRRAVAEGTPVRLRLVNSDNTVHRFALTGAPFRVVALDGTDLNDPSPLENVSLDVPAGGRADLGFTMPTAAVRLSLADAPSGLALSPDGRDEPPAAVPEPTFDPLAYGRPAATAFDASSEFDRRFRLEIGRKPGFFDGRPGMQWTINGGIFPDVPVFHVEEGDLIRITIANTAAGVHPMHLHGHRLLVLSRNGVPSTGSPWWVDTLDVDRGEQYVLAFRADNPGIWMDHCHNLRHAAEGLSMHVAYAGVSTPFNVGGDVHNHPE